MFSPAVFVLSHRCFKKLLLREFAGTLTIRISRGWIAIPLTWVSFASRQPSFFFTYFYILISIIFHMRYALVEFFICLSRVLRHAQDHVESILCSTSWKDTNYRFTKLMLRICRFRSGSKIGEQNGVKLRSVGAEVP